MGEVVVIVVVVVVLVVLKLERESSSSMTTIKSCPRDSKRATHADTCTHDHWLRLLETDWPLLKSLWFESSVFDAVWQHLGGEAYPEEEEEQPASWALDDLVRVSRFMLTSPSVGSAKKIIEIFQAVIQFNFMSYHDLSTCIWFANPLRDLRIFTSTACTAVIAGVFATMHLSTRRRLTLCVSGHTPQMHKEE